MTILRIHKAATRCTTDYTMDQLKRMARSEARARGGRLTGWAVQVTEVSERTDSPLVRVSYNLDIEYETKDGIRGARVAI